MIVAFAGFSGWTDAAFIRADIDSWMGTQEWAYRNLNRNGPLTVRVGDEPEGAEYIIRDWFAGVDAVKLTVYTADVTALGRKLAKANANKRMLVGENAWDPTSGKPADLLIAYPQPNRIDPAKGSSTWNAITQAWYRGVEVRIPPYKESESALRAQADPLLPFETVVAS